MVYSVFSLYVIDLESKLMNKCYVDKFWWCVWLWRVCFGFNFFVIIVLVVVLGLFV